MRSEEVEDADYDRWTVGELTLPPSGADASCSICRAWKNGAVLCETCETVAEELGEDLTPVVPVTIYSKPSMIRDVLTFYKEQHRDLRSRSIVRSIVLDFLAANQSGLDNSYGPWDGFVVVPSTQGRIPHPLELMLDNDLIIHKVF